MKYLPFFSAIIAMALGLVHAVFLHEPNIIFNQPAAVVVRDPERSRIFYDELKGQPRDFIISSDRNFDLYINVLVPELANHDGRYSVDIFSVSNSIPASEEKIATIDGAASTWVESYDSTTRDYYLKGPEFEKELPAGSYKVEVFSNSLAGGNQGKYALAMGKKEFFSVPSLVSAYWKIPYVKLAFFNSDVLQFFLTPFAVVGVAAIGAFLIVIAALYYVLGLAVAAVRHSQAKTLLFTSAGMAMKDEIKKLLQKPAYDVTVAFITTAAKPQEDVSYVKQNWTIMREEMGFNIEEVDIEGKTEQQVMDLLKLKDIIFVEGGNTFYLLKAMRRCRFERVIRKLLKLGKVYIGASAGSIVAGKTIKTAGWSGDENSVKIHNLRGLNLVPFDLWVHYRPEDAAIIKKKLWWWQRRKLKILTDEQAILVQGRGVSLIGKGEKIIV